MGLFTVTIIGLHTPHDWCTREYRRGMTLVSCKKICSFHRGWLKFTSRCSRWRSSVTSKGREKGREEVLREEKGRARWEEKRAYASYKKNFSFGATKFAMETPTRLIHLPISAREFRAAFCALFRSNSANTNHCSKYSDRSIGLMANVQGYRDYADIDTLRHGAYRIDLY